MGKPRRIQVDIDSLVLEGLSGPQAEAVVSAIRRELPGVLRAESRAPLTARRVEAGVTELVSSRLRR